MTRHVNITKLDGCQLITPIHSLATLLPTLQTNNVSHIYYIIIRTAFIYGATILPSRLHGHKQPSTWRRPRAPQLFMMLSSSCSRLSEIAVSRSPRNRLKSSRKLSPSSSMLLCTHLMLLSMDGNPGSPEPTPDLW